MEQDHSPKVEEMDVVDSLPNLCVVAVTVVAQGEQAEFSRQLIIPGLEIVRDALHGGKCQILKDR